MTSPPVREIVVVAASAGGLMALPVRDLAARVTRLVTEKPGSPPGGVRFKA